jgi:trk system potassium uptake protein
MRLAFIGATELVVRTATALIKTGHEVIIVERDAERIKQLNGQLDCAFLHGDGSKPDLLKELDPEKIDILYCVTNHDQTNIISSLIAKTLGVPRVLTMIEDEGFLPVCEHLGLADTIIPVLTISHYLVGLAAEKLKA